jgi:hypothetical protein
LALPASASPRRHAVHLLLGEDFDPFALCALSSTLTRIGSRLGFTRKARTVETPALRDYLDAKGEEAGE